MIIEYAQKKIDRLSKIVLVVFQWALLLVVVVSHSSTIVNRSWAQGQAIKAPSFSEEQEFKGEVKALSPLSFSTEFESDQSSLAIFNLLRFRGEPKKWENAQLELKFSLSPNDQNLVKRFNRLNDETISRLRSFFPPVDYDSAGTLSSISQLVKPIWVVWVPQEQNQITAHLKDTLTKTLKKLRAEAEAEGSLHLYVGQKNPQISYQSNRIADMNFDQIKYLSQALLKKKQNITPSLTGLSRILEGIELRYSSQFDRFQEVNYSCGRACREMVPNVRLIILCDESIHFTAQIPKKYQAIFKSTQYSKHILYQPHLYFLNIGSKLSEVKAHIPTWLSQLSYFNRTPQETLGSLEELSREIAKIQNFADSVYYAVPPIAIPQYYWGNEEAKVQARLTVEESSVVRETLLRFPFDDRKLLREQRKTSYLNQRKQLNEAQKLLIKPKSLSFVTEVVIGILWICLSLSAILVIIIRMRKNRSLTSQPAIKIDEEAFKATIAIQNELSQIDSVKAGTEDQTSLNQADLMLLPDWSTKQDPVERERNKRRERELSNKVNKPSQASPMIDPEDPSTVPAPAAEAKISDQPSEALSQRISNEPKSQYHDSESPVENIELIADVLSLHSIPPENKSQQETAHPESFSSIMELDQSLAKTSYESFSSATLKHSLYNDPSEAVTVNKNPLAGIYAEQGPMKRFFFLIFQSPAVVGRNPQNQCPLPPNGFRSDRQVSRDHFELSQIEDQKWEVRCKSEQGLILNQTELFRGDTAIIQDRDLILIGDTTLRFRCSTVWRTHQVKEHLKLTKVQAT